MSSSNDRRYDPAVGLWWDARQRCWYNQQGQRVNDSSRPSQPSSSQQAPRQSQPTIRDTISAMERLNVNPKTGSSSQPGDARQAAPSSGRTGQGGSGAPPPGSNRPPDSSRSAGASNRRSQNPEAGRSSRPQNRRSAPRPGSELTPESIRIGRVIEVLFVPPGTNETNVSRISPNGSWAQYRDGVRFKRYVIVDVQQEQHRFRALMIKTYGGRGVASPGVIKWRHSIIYTNNRPDPTPEERPRRLPSGDLEDAMQPQAILVLQGDRTMALDPMSRLDYSSDYTFDFSSRNIRCFGRVHNESLAFLFAQWSAVYYSIHPSAGSLSTNTILSASNTIVPPGHPAYDGQTAQPGRSLQPGQPVGRTVQPNQPVPAGRPAPQGQFSTTPGQGGTGASARPAFSAEQALALLQRYSQQNSGPCTEQEMQMILIYLYNFGRERGWRVPDMSAASQRLGDLARNATLRSSYIQQIRTWWAQDAEEDDESDSQDED